MKVGVTKALIMADLSLTSGIEDVKQAGFVRKLGLEYGNYTVTVYISNSGSSQNFDFDGFTVFNTMPGLSSDGTIYESDGEINPNFTSFVTEANDTTKFSFSGYDESSYPTLAESLTYYELYLYPGCSVTFKVDTAKVSSMQLNMRSLNGEESTYTVNSDSGSLSAIAMYYPIDLSEDGEVTITNTSTSSIIAINDIKYFLTGDDTDIFLDL